MTGRGVFWRDAVEVFCYDNASEVRMGATGSASPGFTLIEIFVIVAIISALAMLAIPDVLRVRRLGEL